MQTPDLNKPGFILNCLNDIFEDKRFFQGNYSKDYETEISQKLGVQYTKFTDNIYKSIQHLIQGLELPLNSDVICSAIGTQNLARSLLQIHQKPIFADLDAHPFMHSNKDFEKVLTTNTKAIIVYHPFNISENSHNLRRFADKNKLLFIEIFPGIIGSSQQPHTSSIYSDIAFFGYNPKTFNKTDKGNKGLYLSDSARFIRLTQAKNTQKYRCLSEYHSAIGLWWLDQLENSLKHLIKLQNIYDDFFLNAKNISIFKQSPQAKYSLHGYPVLFENAQIKDKIVMHWNSSKHINLSNYTCGNGMIYEKDVQKKHLHSKSRDFCERLLKLPLDVYTNTDDAIKYAKQILNNL